MSETRASTALTITKVGGNCPCPVSNVTDHPRTAEHSHAASSSAHRLCLSRAARYTDRDVLRRARRHQARKVDVALQLRTRRQGNGPGRVRSAAGTPSGHGRGRAGCPRRSTRRPRRPCGAARQQDRQSTASLNGRTRAGERPPSTRLGAGVSLAQTARGEPSAGRPTGPPNPGSASNSGKVVGVTGPRRSRGRRQRWLDCSDNASSSPASSASVACGSDLFLLAINATVIAGIKSSSQLG